MIFAGKHFSKYLVQLMAFLTIFCCSLKFDLNLFSDLNSPGTILWSEWLTDIERIVEDLLTIFLRQLEISKLIDT